MVPLAQPDYSQRLIVSVVWVMSLCLGMSANFTWTAMDRTSGERARYELVRLRGARVRRTPEALGREVTRGAIAQLVTIGSHAIPQLPATFLATGALHTILAASPASSPSKLQVATGRRVRSQITRPAGVRSMGGEDW